MTDKEKTSIKDILKRKQGLYEYAKSQGHRAIYQGVKNEICTILGLLSDLGYNINTW